MWKPVWPSKIHYLDDVGLGGSLENSSFSSESISDSDKDSQVSKAINLKLNLRSAIQKQFLQRKPGILMKIFSKG